MNISERLYIRSNNDQIACIVDYEKSRTELNTIILHGGGPSSKENTEYLVPILLKNNKACVRFDYSGQGESSGKLELSSLEKRKQETLTVLNELGMGSRSITIIGTSMAGHIACSLINEIDVESLILFCPAAYSIDAWNVEFGKGFTEIIRKRESYMNSNIEELLYSFKRRIMLVLPREDAIIPNQVINLYKREVEKRLGSFVINISNCPHPIHKWIINKEEEKQLLLNQLDLFLKYEKDV
jgi:hypothetical protein